MSIAQGKHHHHIFHHNKEEQNPVETVVFSEAAYGVDGAGQRYETTDTVGFTALHPDFDKELKSHQRKDHPAAPYALYEKHQAKKDQVHENKNKIEEEIEKAVAVGVGGFTFHEHNQKKGY